MEQPWTNQQREGGGLGFSMGESSCHGAADLDQVIATTDPCELDGALLMQELMDDLLPSSDLLLDDGDVDRQLSHVIRSLEAEIGGDQQAAAVMMADEGGESLDTDDDMDGFDYEGASPFGYEGEGWCVYTDTNGYEGGGVLGYDTMVDHHYSFYCCAEGSADHMMYLPLWE